MEISRLMITVTNLFPSSQIQKYMPFFREVFEYADITTPKRMAYFLGQIGIECQGFRVFGEDLFYTSPSRLIDVWPTRFRLPVQGELKTTDTFLDRKRNPHLYLRNPQKLANYVYSSRNGNRDEASGDGYRFRGRGPKQLTGASNYVEFTRALGAMLKTDFIKNPDALLLPRNGLYAAAWFWKTNNLNRYADLGDITNVSRIVNGGVRTVKERGILTDRALVSLMKAA